MQKIFFPSSKPRFIDERLVAEGFKKIALRLAQKNKNVEAVYLFGSYSSGNAGIHSDADILVIIGQDARKRQDRLDEFILEFSDGPVPADVLVATRAELESALAQGNHFYSNAAGGMRLF